VFGYGVIKLDFTGVFQVSLIIKSTVVWVNRTGGRHGMQICGSVNFYAVQTYLFVVEVGQISYFSQNPGPVMDSNAGRQNEIFVRHVSHIGVTN
jgi:hypothetical protein